MDTVQPVPPHGPNGRRDFRSAAGSEDVRGHAAGGAADPQDEDTEGHATRSGRLLPDSQDDTEGHGIRSGRALPEEEDDVEGHGIRSGRVASEEDEDTEGHGTRGQV